MLGGAACRVWCARPPASVCHLLEPAQTMVDGPLRQLHATRKLAEVELRVGAPPASHLTQRGRHPVQLASGFETLDRRRLPQPGPDRLADVRGLEDETPVE